MLPEYLRGFSRQRSQAPRRRPAGARRVRRSAWRPELESLEERLTLTGNITITGVSVVGANDQPLPVVSVGEWVYIQAHFTTQELPTNASYRVGYTVNGLTLDTGYLNWGAGRLGTGYWVAYWGTFIASPGVNQVTVTVDPDHSVAETSYADNTMSFTFNTGPGSVSPYMSYTVAQMRAAYGINSIPDFGSATADGSGQTIAIVDVYNDPSILTDLDGFGQVMDLTTNSSESLYQQYGPASSILTVYNQTGTDITSEISNSGVGGVPPVDPPGDWQGEETMDVEWAHAIAPGAHIDLIECDGTGSFYGLFSGAATAAELPGVSVVSMSWIWSEGNWSGSNGSGELAYDSSTFVTPSGHPGVTFLASTGDGGSPGGYPAFSPNVVAVGGTQLSLNSDTYGSETGWSFPVPRVLVNGGPSYSQTGPWTSQPGGFSLTYSAAAAGSDSSATWTTPLAPSDLGWSGGTEVSATWVANPGNATNATYDIYDVWEPSATIESVTLMGIVTVDQTKAPVGTAAGGFQFQELGDYYPRSGSTLEVDLDANTADGTVVADTVGIAPSWASGGGQSRYESEPSYQLPFQSTGYRTTPDVSFDASQNSGVTVFQDGGLAYDDFGTSLSSPCWAGLIAIADQGRVASGGMTLNSPANPMQTLQALYSLPAGDFHDITSGYNGLSAGAGYDEVTGRGSPVANLLVPDLASYGLPSQLAIIRQPPAVVDRGSAFGLTVAVEDRFGDVITNFNGSVTIAIGDNPDPGVATLGGTLTVPVVNGIATFSDLTLNKAGYGYRLEASSAGLAAATTIEFNVPPPPILRRVASMTAVSPNPRNTPVSAINVTFNEPINTGSLSAGALTLTDNDGGNLIAGGVSLILVSGTTSTYAIDGLAALTEAEGNYTMTVNAADIQDPSGNPGSGTLSTSWLMDATPPTSQVNALPAREASLSFSVSVTASDPNGANSSPPSGVASDDIYVSTNGGPWSPWTTVPAANPTATYTGQSNTTYAFYSVAHDRAGNTENQKPMIEASTYVPNLTPPVTSVDGTTGTNPSSVNTSAGTFTLNLTGSDPGGGIVTDFEVFVSVDSGPYTLINGTAIPAGPPDGQGNSHATIPYQGLTDGAQHQYSFYSIGIDSAGNVQSAPSTPNLSLTAIFARPSVLQVTNLIVENGAVERSYIRYLDVAFNESNSQSGSELTQIADSIGTSSPVILLYKYDLNGDASSKTAVSLSGVSVTVIDHAIELDFGAKGIGGNPNTTAADGYYEVDIKLQSGQVAVHHFYRLLGDVTGDGVVDQNDLSQIAAKIGVSSQPGMTPLDAAVTGDGTVSAFDLMLATRSKGRKLGSGLSLG